MKKFLAVITILLATAAFTSVASALPFLPGANAEDGLFLQFKNKEQISSTNSIKNDWNGDNDFDDPGETEGNWGIFDVSSITLGDFTSDPQNFDPATGGQIWAADLSTGEFTGMFGGITVLQAGEPGYVAGELNAVGGWLDLYYDADDDGDLAGALPTDRTAEDGFTGFTDGTLLARFNFLLGGIGPDISITGDSVPTVGTNFAGIALSFGTVADVNGDGNIDAADGAWAEALDSDYFHTELGDNTADIRFRNIYEGPLPTWNGTDDIIGASSTDPARMVIVPEPTTMALFGLGLLGVAGISRRRKES